MLIIRAIVAKPFIAVPLDLWEMLWVMVNKTDRRVRGSGSSELSSNTEKSLGADRTHQTFTLTRESRAPVRIAYHFYFFYEEIYFEFITTYNISEHTFSSGDHTDIASQLSHVRSRSLRGNHMAQTWFLSCPRACELKELGKRCTKCFYYKEIEKFLELVYRG